MMPASLAERTALSLCSYLAFRCFDSQTFQFTFLVLSALGTPRPLVFRGFGELFAPHGLSLDADGREASNPVHSTLLLV